MGDGPDILEIYESSAVLSHLAEHTRQERDGIIGSESSLHHEAIPRFELMISLIPDFTGKKQRLRRNF